MTKTIILSTLSFLFCSILVSCDKEEEANGNQTLSEKKISGKWTITKMERQETNGSWTDITKDCNLDDTENFSADKTWSLHLGNTKCSEGERQTTNGTWRFSGNDTQITFTYTIAEGEYHKKVEQLTDNILVLSHNSNNTSQTIFRNTYKK